VKLLKVDEKWSIQYDPEMNDRPLRWLRYGEHNSMFNENNSCRAMFYSLLEARKKLEEIYGND